jgi:hypothetical protein
METAETTTRRLYSAGQICTAAFIGSPVAACWFFAHNYRQLGNTESARKWLFWGCGGSFVFIVLVRMLPLSLRFPPYVIPLGYSIALREVAKQTQGDAVTQHISTGGRLGSWWVVVGISLLFFAGMFGVLFAGYCLFG